MFCVKSAAGWENRDPVQLNTKHWDDDSRWSRKRVDRRTQTLLVENDDGLAQNPCGAQGYSLWRCIPYAVVTCETKLFQNCFSLRRRPTEIILFQRVETCLKLFRNYFTGILQLVNIFRHVWCRWNSFEIISAAEIILVQFQTWLRVKHNSEVISTLFQNNFISHVATVLHLISRAISHVNVLNMGKSQSACYNITDSKGDAPQPSPRSATGDVHCTRIHRRKPTRA